MEAAITGYLSLLEGFITASDGAGGESKLRYAVNFKWTNSMLGLSVVEQQDAIFDFCCILVNIGLWYTKHAAVVAGKDGISMDEAKDVHKCLRKAAGVFQLVKDEKGKLLQQEMVTAPGADLDSRILDAYMHQSVAEAQEVTVARAIELKHAASLTSALANETSKIFQSALVSLQTLEDPVFGKWKIYLQLKHAIYQAYAYTYMGENLLAQDQGGSAVSAMKQALKWYESSELLCKEYAAAKGPGLSAKPESHLFFRRLGPLVRRILEKAERENGFIYHQNVPEEPPELELKATYGLAKPEEFSLSKISSEWTPAVYSAFDLSRGMKEDAKKSAGGGQTTEKLPEMQEKSSGHSGNDQNNTSGCILS
ncbi:PREDICTED: BRO1 domain-containing protein BROX-like [Priapulus caudatus]|uniref:BRO1 domain-containing protein BROX-like n=1 Tax=Priapulus caudatus TaxID=37621 RepID=A0ABM1EC55_PRICU|nr:PREDICTED: BRO1 domain-containing protein BROX-like [Priapulus caudatus]